MAQHCVGCGLCRCLPRTREQSVSVCVPSPCCHLDLAGVCAGSCLHLQQMRCQGRRPTKATRGIVAAIGWDCSSRNCTHRDVPASSTGIVGRVAQVVEVPLTDPAGWMTGECTAYLRHLLSGLARSGPVHSLADYTIFLHDDAPRHLKQEFLSIVFRSLSLGTYNVSFLNLAHERYVSAVTPCLKQLYAMVMGRQLAGRLSTYCCGHFVVKSSRLHEIPLEPLRRLYAAVQAGTYTAQAGGPCEAISVANSGGAGWSKLRRWPPTSHDIQRPTYMYMCMYTYICYRL